MTLTRQHNYDPGTSARGDFVEQEYDSIIAFCNQLDSNKLDSNGGSVNNLTITGALTSTGTATFDAGFTVNNQQGVFNAGVTADTINTVDINASGTGTFDFLLVNLGATFDGAVTLNGNTSVSTGATFTIQDPPVDPLDATNKLYVDNEVANKIDLNVDNVITANHRISGSNTLAITSDVGTGGSKGTFITNKLIKIMESLSGPSVDHVTMGDTGLSSSSYGFSATKSSGTDLGVSTFLTWDSVTIGIKTSGLEPDRLELDRRYIDLFRGGASKFRVFHNTSILEMYAVDLPTSAPAGTNQIWNNAGVLNIT